MAGQAETTELMMDGLILRAGTRGPRMVEHIGAWANGKRVA